MSDGGEVGAKAFSEDLALLWCLEFLLSSTKVDSHALMAFMANLSWNSLLHGRCPYSFKCRIFLHRLKRQPALTMETVESLETLASLVKSWSRDDTAVGTRTRGDIKSLVPNPVLISRTKVAIVARYWIENPQATVAESQQRVLEVFGSTVVPEDRALFEDCMMAVTDVNHRKKLIHDNQSSDILEMSRAFADSCLGILGTPVIDAVVEDVSSGRYRVGSPSGLGKRVSNLSTIVSDVHISTYDDSMIPQGHHNADCMNNNGPGRLMPAPLDGLGNIMSMQMGDATQKDQHDIYSQSEKLVDALETTAEMLMQQQRRNVPGTSSSLDPSGAESMLLMLQKGFPVHSENNAIQMNVKQKLEPSTQRTNISGVKRRPNRWWGEQEVAALKLGLLKYGPGRWAKILRENNDILYNRTQVDLKDKWRNMRRNKSDEDVKAILDRWSKSS